MNSTTTQPTATPQDAGQAARALGNAQALLRGLRREAVELPLKLGEARERVDMQQIKALHERRRTLPAAVHLARMSVLATGIEALKAELVSIQDAEAQLVTEAAEIQEMTRRLQVRMKDVNERLMPVRSQVNYMTKLIERKASALNAEQEYMISSEAADDPTASVWAMLPGDPDEGLQALIAQVKAIRATSLEDEAHTADDERLMAVLNEAAGVFRDQGRVIDMDVYKGGNSYTTERDLPPGIPAGDKAMLHKHLREELALILA